MPRPESGAGSRGWRALPSGIWVMGFVSLLMDASSEMIFSLFPVFMVSVLGASMMTVGLIEGIAEGTAAILKVFSGTLSDYLGRRKMLMVLGYGLSAISKPLFPLASSIYLVFTARFVDRLGKGIREAPRDALIADMTGPGLRGSAYGLRQALDSVGALLGPLLAVAFMMLYEDRIRSVMWLAVVPAVLSVMLLAYVRESRRASSPNGAMLSIMDVRRLPLRYWMVVLLGAAFTLARFSEAFLVLRAQSVGLGIAYIPLVMVAMNVCYSMAAYPAGAAADRLSPRVLLLGGLALLIAADILLALVPSLLFAGAALWGLHMALTKGLLSKLVADTVPADLRGTGFGIFDLVSGVVLLLASVIAGFLWSRFGAPFTFLAGAGFAAVAASGLLFFPVLEKN